MGTSRGFAVVDTETTGKFAAKDRIIEIGIVLLDENFEVQEEFETLINPDRDAGPQHIHGIRSEWLLEAPDFQAISGEVSQKLQGRIFVAHNAAFDLAFIESEYRRIDPNFSIPREFDGSFGPGMLCTKTLARSVFGKQPPNFEWLCEQLGVENISAHAALSDARATAEVLKSLLKSTPHLSVILKGAEFEKIEWPEFESKNQVSFTPRTAASENLKKPFIYRLIALLPPQGGSPDFLDYVDALEKALIDLVISESEAQSLLQIAESRGLSVQSVKDVHETLFSNLVTLAWADGMISESEEQDLRKAGEILGISSFDVEAKLAKRQTTELSELPEVYELGQSFVLTGDMQPPKAEVRGHLLSIGYLEASGVSKKVSFVVAEDPDSMSGKAKRARELGIPVVSTEYVWKLPPRRST